MYLYEYYTNINKMHNASSLQKLVIATLSYTLWMQATLKRTGVNGNKYSNKYVSSYYNLLLWALIFIWYLNFELVHLLEIKFNKCLMVYFAYLRRQSSSCLMPFWGDLEQRKARTKTISFFRVLYTYFRENLYILLSI